MSTEQVNPTASTIALPDYIQAGCAAGDNPHVTKTQHGWVVHPAHYDAHSLTMEDLRLDCSVRRLNDAEVYDLEAAITHIAIVTHDDWDGEVIAFGLDHWPENAEYRNAVDSTRRDDVPEALVRDALADDLTKPAPDGWARHSEGDGRFVYVRQ